MVEEREHGCEMRGGRQDEKVRDIEREGEAEQRRKGERREIEGRVRNPGKKNRRWAIRVTRRTSRCYTARIQGVDWRFVALPGDQRTFWKARERAG